jgi:hypothetical protein
VIRAVAEIDAVVDWYLATAYGRWEGPSVLPFFADPRRVGHYAVKLELLAGSEPATLFRLLVSLAMYQSRRDVDIMAIQKAMPAHTVASLTSPKKLKVLAQASKCEHLSNARSLTDGCDVMRSPNRAGATCTSHPRMACHVKDATVAIGRMGDMGKLPTSAWLVPGDGGLPDALSEICIHEDDPEVRAEDMVARLALIHRIGRKLASLYVSVLSTPALFGVAPWYPLVDGSRLVVVDANVAAAVAMWRGARAPRTCGATTKWLTRMADVLASTKRRPPHKNSPRFVQQAIYTFRSRSNRQAAGDRCATKPCGSCPSRVCPFIRGYR